MRYNVVSGNCVIRSVPQGGSRDLCISERSIQCDECCLFVLPFLPCHTLIHLPPFPLSELCSGGDSEVEIVSLLSEGLPNYTLRADCMFGYDHDDWLHTPLLPPEVALGLTHDQIEETLKYFCKSTTLSTLGIEHRRRQLWYRCAKCTAPVLLVINHLTNLDWRESTS